MALFEFEDGHLVPAQFGYPVAQDLGPELVDAICQQVLQIVSRPLFPVTWRDMTGQVDEETPRLTALDVTGQIVSVEILKRLDSETLITSLSRLAVVASLSWSDLAAEYPSGPEGFRKGWAQFRDSMPPAVGPGPRLIMVAGEIDPSVRPALSILATSGVEVHLMNLRQMSNGRLFLDVNAVGPRLYGHAPQLLGSAAAAPAIAAPATPTGVDDLADADALDEKRDASETPPESIDEGVDEEHEDGTETPTTRPTPKVAPHLRDVFAYSVDEEPPAPWQPADEERAPEETTCEERAPEERADEAVDASVPETSSADAPSADEGPAGDSLGGDRDAEAGDERPEDGVHEAGESETREAGRDGAAGVNGQDDETGDDLADDARERDAEKGVDDGAANRPGDGLEEWSEHDYPGERAVYLNDEMDSNEERYAPQGERSRWERPAHLGSRASRRAQSEPEELNDGGATAAATASFVDRAEESPEVVQARAEGVPVLGRDEAGLRTLAQILGEDTPLVARGELGLPDDLVLAASGAICGAGLTYPSLDTMLTARGMGHIDAWALVRIGDRLGPTLAEALDEVNREIVREYAHAPRERRAARH